MLLFLITVVVAVIAIAVLVAVIAVREVVCGCCNYNKDNKR